MIRLFNKLDKVLLFFTIVMFVFGLFMIFDASSPKADLIFDNSLFYFNKQLAILGLSLVGSILFLLMPTKKYVKYIIPGAVVLLILLALLLLFGGESNGAKSWFYIFGFGLQPSEFAKLGMIIFMSVYYGLTYKRLNKIHLVAIPLVIGAVIFILTAAQPDMGTAIIILIIVASLFYISPVQPKFKKIVTLVGIGFVLTAGTILLIFGDKILTKTQMDRFNFLKPCTRYQESTGYQVCNGYIAINNGKLISLSPGNSKQVYLYLPEAYTDFIYPIIVEEFGLIVGLLVILIYALIIYRIILVGKNSNNITNQMLCYGVAVFLFSHVIVNLVGVLGLLPLTGVPLPFLSYGGSFAITVSLSLTVVQRVSIENYNERKRKVLV